MGLVLWRTDLGHLDRWTTPTDVDGVEYVGVARADGGENESGAARHVCVRRCRICGRSQPQERCAVYGIPW